MPITSTQDLSAAVLAAVGGSADPRRRRIMQSLVKHLHAFVQDVELTEAEFRDATAVLQDMGRLCTDSHNEFVLMAGSLGVSALVCLQNNTGPGQATTSQNLLGPFWRLNAPRLANGASLVQTPTAGEPLFVELLVVDADDQPVADAQVNVWHCNGVGLYENQDPSQASHNLRGQFITNATGAVHFRTVKPVGYPIPVHTVVGRMLQDQGRHPYRPAHVHAVVFKDGYKTLVTQLYAADDPRLETDVQFGATAALTAVFERHLEAHPRQADVVGPWFTLRHRLVVQPGVAHLPRAPIK